MHNPFNAFTILVAIIGLLIVPEPTFSHHGTNINYNWSEAFVARAIVTEFHFATPHPQIYFDAEDAEGNVVNWACEIGPSVPWLIRQGWTRKRSIEALEPGTPVTVTITPSKSGNAVGALNKIVNDRGEVILPEFRTDRPDFSAKPIQEFASNLVFSERGL